MKKTFCILFLIFFISSYASGDTVVDGVGISEGGDVGFSNITATRIDATTGVFGNITTESITATGEILSTSFGTISTVSIGVGVKDNGWYTGTGNNLVASANGVGVLQITQNGLFGLGAGGVFLNTLSSTILTMATNSDTNTGFGNEVGNIDTAVITSGGIRSATFGLSSTVFYPAGSGQIKMYNNGNMAIGGGVAFSSITTLTSTGDAPTSYHHFHCDATAGDVTFNVHSSASGPKGLVHNFLKIDSSANDCILDGAGGETFSGSTTITISTQWENITIYTDQSNWFIE